MKKRFFLATATLLALALLAPVISSAQSEAVKENAPVTADRMKFINMANTMLGVAFRLNGEKPETGFDSFGLIKYSAQKSLGKKLPKDAQKLYDAMESHPKKKELVPGDIVFFKSNPNGKITDAGIYLGYYQVEGKYFGKEVFLYASPRPVKIGKRKRTRASVAIGDMNDYVFKNQFFGTGRFLNIKDETLSAMVEKETTDIFQEENVKASDFEDVKKDINSASLESGVGEQFAEAEQKAIEIANDLTSEVMKLSGGESKFKAATAEKKREWLEKAKAIVKNLEKYAGDFSDSTTQQPSSTSSSTKITQTSVSTLDTNDASEPRLEFVQYSMKFVDNPHVPYVWGGTTPAGFDCSGFVQYSALHGINIVLPRTAAAMSNYAQAIPKSKLEAGDLVFFKSHGKVSHVGIYLGKYRGSGRLSGREVFVNAASAGPSTGVTLSALDEPTWKRTFCGGGRILPAASDSASQLDFAVAKLLE